MNEILFQYEKIDPTTWVYLASLLIIGLFFKFGRFWSVRNLDLLLLILLAPGLLLVSEGQVVQRLAMTTVAAARAEAAKLPQNSIEPVPPASPTGSPAGPSIDGSTDASEMPTSPEAVDGGDTAGESTGEDAGDAATGSSDETVDGTTEGDADGTAGGGVDGGGVDGTADEAAVGQGDQRNGKKSRSEEPTDSNAAESKKAVPKRVTKPELTPTQKDLMRGQTIERIGFMWLLLAGLLLLVRLLVDSTMVRRPLLEPNMTTGGLTFSCCSLFVFLMANVVASHPTADDLAGPISAERMMSRQASDDLDRHGPGYALVFALPSLPTVKMGTRPLVDDPSVQLRRWEYRAEPGGPLEAIDARFLDLSSGEVELEKLDGTQLSVSWEDLSESDQGFVRKIRAYTTIAKLVAILSHLAVVIGIIAIGFWHFNNVKMGIGAATLYLMLPYTSQMTGRVDHALPAALLVWAVLCYRRPLVSGFFMGMAIGVIYYPLFLLPLWFSFYWRRGLLRFSIGLVSVLTIMVITLAFISADLEAFWQCIKKMFGLMPPQMEGLGGIWGLGWAPVYRYPVLAAFIAMCGSLAIWPAQKNLGTVLSCSAAIIVATQFWHGYGGGLYMAWYLPLLLLTVFRPNLEDRTAISVVEESWGPQR